MRDMKKYAVWPGFIVFGIMILVGISGCVTTKSETKTKSAPVSKSTKSAGTQAVSTTTTTATQSLDTTSPGTITLKWRTESEQENYGFNLFRGLSKDGPWERVNDKIITGHGTTSEPHDYRYVDKGVKKNTTYYYQLEEVDLAGNASRKPYTIKGIDNKPVTKESPEK